MRTEVWQHRGLTVRDQCDTDRRQGVPGSQWKIVYHLAVIRQAKVPNGAILGMRGEWYEGSDNRATL